MTLANPTNKNISVDFLGEKSINLIGMSLQQMEAEMTEIGEPSFRASQLYKWVYNRGVTNFESMTNIAKTLRSELAKRYFISRPAISKSLDSIDGTHKWLIKLADGNEIETVHIPESDRGTLCILSLIHISEPTRPY